MAVSKSGISTLGIKLGYGVSARTTKPLTFKWLERANSVGGIDLPVEQIDSSALEDYQTRYIAGRQDSGGEWEVTFNYTEEVETLLNGMISAYNSKGDDDVLWLEVWTPQSNSAFFVIAQPPKKLPMPEMGQNELMTIAVTFSIDEYLGTSSTGVVEPTA